MGSSSSRQKVHPTNGKSSLEDDDDEEAGPPTSSLHAPKILPSVQFYGKLGDVDVTSTDGKMERSSYNSIRLYFVVDHLGVKCEVFVLCEASSRIAEEGVQYDMRVLLHASTGDLFQSGVFCPKKRISGIDNVVEEFKCVLISGLGTKKIELFGELSWFEEPSRSFGSVAMVLDEGEYLRYFTENECTVTREHGIWSAHCAFVLATGETYGLTFDIPTFQTFLRWEARDLKVAVVRSAIDASRTLSPLVVETFVGWFLKGTGKVVSESVYRLRFQGEICDSFGKRIGITALFCADLEFWDRT